MQRLYKIDLLRFLAAFFVVLFYYAFRAPGQGMGLMPYPALLPMAQYGYLSVHLFFMISGLVILMTASNGSARHFVISRIIRLYPAFIVCCTLTFLVIIGFGGELYQASLKQYLINLTMLGGFFNIKEIDGVYWTLYVEIKFYLLVFLIVLAGQIDKSKILLGLWLIPALLTTTPLIRYIPAFIIPDSAPFFIAGALFFLLYKEGPCPYKLFMLFASFAGSLLTAALKAEGKAWHHRITFDFSVISLVLGVFFIVFFLLASRLSAHFSSPCWNYLGTLTYPLYSIHHTVGFIIFMRLYPGVNPHLLMWGTVALMLVIAHLVHTKVERICARPLKNKLEKLFLVRSSVSQPSIQ